VRVGSVVRQADVEEASVLLGLERVHVSDGWADNKVLGSLENKLSGFSRFNNTFVLEDF
jgi:hypothetical protein